MKLALHIEAGNMRVKMGRLWLPDGLHIWWGNRGVHLYWHGKQHVMFDRLDTEEGSG